ncbi:MAG: MBL fold metallo-hydrolase, partial [Gammaproteobacteria bacterium]
MFIWGSSLSAAGTPDDDRLSLHVLDCGGVHGMDSELFLPNVAERPERIEMTNRCFLIDHPDGTLLWDLGFPQSAYYRMLATLFWIKNFGQSSIEIGEPLPQQLIALGFDPSAIDFVAVSHLHFDHVGAANDFEYSTWLVRPAERDWAFSEDLDVD